MLVFWGALLRAPSCWQLHLLDLTVTQCDPFSSLQRAACAEGKLQYMNSSRCCLPRALTSRLQPCCESEREHQKH